MAIDRSRNTLTPTVDLHGRTVMRWQRDAVAPSASQLGAIPSLRSLGDAGKSEHYLDPRGHLGMMAWRGDRYAKCCGQIDDLCSCAQTVSFDVPSPLSDLLDAARSASTYPAVLAEVRDGEGEAITVCSEGCCLQDGHDVFAAAIEADIEDVRFVYGEQCSLSGRILSRWNPDPSLGGDGYGRDRRLMEVADTPDNRRVAKVLGLEVSAIDLETADVARRAYYAGYASTRSFDGHFDHAGIANWLIDAPLKYTDGDGHEEDEDYGSERWVGNFEKARRIRRAAHLLAGTTPDVLDPHLSHRGEVSRWEAKKDTDAEDVLLALSLLKAIEDAPVHEGPLYRGTHMSGVGADEVLAQFQVGTQLHAPVWSTTDGQELADAFGKARRDQPGAHRGGTVVNYVIEPGAKALHGRVTNPAVTMMRTKTGANHVEWVTGGTFEVLDARAGAGETITVRLRQQDVTKLDG